MCEYIMERVLRNSQANFVNTKWMALQQRFARFLSDVTQRDFDSQRPLYNGCILPQHHQVNT